MGVVGTAPSQLEWRRPALMENALRGYGPGTLGLKGDLVREPRLEYESPRRSAINLLPPPSESRHRGPRCRRYVSAGPLRRAL